MSFTGPSGSGQRPSASETLEQIIDSLLRPYEVNGKLLHRPPSLRIIRYPSNGMETETLLANADDSMCESKHQGCAMDSFYGDDELVADISL
jgi:predicted signal transduction protein with EAL and GGDEF domain